MDGLRNDNGMEWMDVELMSTRGPRANGRGMDEHPVAHIAVLESLKPQNLKGSS